MAVEGLQNGAAATGFVRLSLEETFHHAVDRDGQHATGDMQQINQEAQRTMELISQNPEAAFGGAGAALVNELEQKGLLNFNGSNDLKMAHIAAINANPERGVALLSRTDQGERFDISIGNEGSKANYGTEPKKMIQIDPDQLGEAFDEVKKSVRA